MKCPLLCPLSSTPSDRSHLFLCFSKTILQLQMSSEIPLPLGNHSLSHCMRSSPSFIGLIFICNFKLVLQIFTVSAGQLIKHFSLFSFQFLLHYTYLVLYQGAYWRLNKSCRNVWILLGSTIVSLSSVCRPSLKLLDFKGKRMLLNLFCLKLFNLPNIWERKLSENLFSYRY